MSPVHLNSIAVTLKNENALPANLEETAGSQVEQVKCVTAVGLAQNRRAVL